MLAQQNVSFYKEAVKAKWLNKPFHFINNSIFLTALSEKAFAARQRLNYRRNKIRQRTD
jgi:hypothetical protein